MNNNADVMSEIFNGPMIITYMVAAFLIMVIFLVIKALQIQKRERSAVDQPSRGHYLSKNIATYMPLGFAVSIPIGFLIKNIALAVALGPLAGLILGALIGSRQEKQHGSELRSLSASEQNLKKTSQTLLTLLIILGMILYFITYFVVR